jgi:hypothetical protein
LIMLYEQNLCSVFGFGIDIWNLHKMFTTIMCMQSMEDFTKRLKQTLSYYLFEA